MNTGQMPRTDFTYEDFENLLASYILTLQPLEDSNDQTDKEDFVEIHEILKSFATRNKIQSPRDAISHPRKTEGGVQAEAFTANWSLVDMLSSFWKDFGVDQNSEEDRQDFNLLVHAVLRMLHRKSIIKARFGVKGKTIFACGVESWHPEREFMPFQ